MRNALILIAACAASGMVGCAADVGSNTAEARLACGGFAGFPCPDGLICVDDPSDGCDPARGGADCIGVCRPERGGPRDCHRGPGVTYVSRSPSECAAIRFLCADGSLPFFDECGCGCAPAGEPCGEVTCGDGQVCCNASCGICTEPDGFCTQQVCEYSTL